MKKRHVIHLLSDYLENLLPEAQRQEVEKHLSSCRPCRSKLEELLKYQQLVSNLERRPAPEEIRAKVMERIDPRHQIPDTRHQMEHGTAKKLVTGHWSLVTALAAIIILLILTIPKHWFMPGNISSDVIGVVQHKKGKGPATIGGVFIYKGEGQRAKGEEVLSPLRLALSEIPDPRLQDLFALLESADAELISAKTSTDGASYSHLAVGMKKKAYKSFAEKYNELKLGETIPAKAGFSMSNNVLVNLFPVKREFFALDYNEDGFCDMILHYTGGRLEGHWFIALNDHMGNFYGPMEITMDSLAPQMQTTDSTLSFTGDFNGDGMPDLGTKYLKGKFISQFHVRFCMDEGEYADPVPFSFGKGVMAWQGDYTHYFGDFNADGLCDMLSKEGDGDVLGHWYLMLNDGSHGFSGAKQVNFGSGEYFVSD